MVRKLLLDHEIVSSDIDPMNKILIADDESLIRYSLASLFPGPHKQLISVDTGIAALDAVRNDRLDLCFLDIHFPDLNGLEIMQAFRAISPWTRIVIVTGSLITEAMLKSIQENAHALITKPFDLDEVGAVAARLLASGRMPKQEGAQNKKDSCVLWMADEVRKHPRRADIRDIECSIVPPAGTKEPIAVPARMLDRSDSGMSILTLVELKPGQVIRAGNGSMNGGGVIRWCVSSGPGGPWRAGIQFLAPKHIEDILGTGRSCWSGNDRPSLLA
jgi:CheY-like chemotaxis protein